MNKKLNKFWIMTDDEPYIFLSKLKKRLQILYIHFMKSGTLTMLKKKLEKIL